ncbi:alginate O-acetyltransferase AlgX-related protein [Pelotomaculum propionicicum]|uniref:AlgX/AlgJ SGNH hydrolase-like domain-containing protein n=1 Tax=Pelotomaculum propionicicum TaxID=258475 RepID=A0A4Y7RN01_9FIRM|nr:hypothetical protein [Pelotomaculum propionicicum]TEB10355.1 hypothetical protein Pmgp_02457 [Pelotomaculum propionicicum]
MVFSSPVFIYIFMPVFLISYYIGIASVVLITPSKASIYPEYIPDAFNKIPVGQNRNYQNFVDLLKQYDVQYLDGHEITMKQKRKSEYPLFCRGGTHWNYLGAYFTTREMILKLQELVNRSITNLECTRIELDDIPSGSDNDLALLLNVWRTPDRYPVPHPVITAAPGGFQPNVLFVGGQLFRTDYPDSGSKRGMLRHLLL